MKVIHIITGISLLTVCSIIFFLPKKTFTPAEPRNITINPPLPGLDIGFDHYQVHPDSPLIIERTNGTVLKVPADCFVKKDGAKPSLKINIRVREFHDPRAILTAGIPMEIAQGNGAHLQSAGMIEMHAYEGEEELNIKKGKHIDISLAAFRNTDNYSLYYLDEHQGWITNGDFTNETNERKKKKLAALSQTPPPPPADDSTSDFIFVISGDTSMNPELKPFIGQEWILIEKEKEQAARTAIRQSWTNVKVERINKRK